MLTVVTGPPCSGKTTWVRDHAQAGDVVVDLDQLGLALTVGVEHHAYPPAVRRVAIHARRAAVSAAIAEHHRGASVWVVHSRPTSAQRAMYRRNGGRLVVMAESMRVLVDRAQAERPAWVLDLLARWRDIDEMAEVE